MNKNVKRILVVILCVLMSFTIFSLIGYAQEKSPAFKLSVDSKAEVGKRVRLFVSIEDMPQFSQADFNFYYDTSSLECLSVAKSASEKPEIWSSDVSNNYGTSSCLYASYKKMQGDKDIAIVIFNVLDLKNTKVTVAVTNSDSEVIPQTVEIDIANTEISIPLRFDYDYEIANSEVIINSCNREAVGEIEIPSKIEGYPVTTIKKDAFQVCNKITGIVIPDTVTTIEEFAFDTCRGLVSVTIGGGVKNLGRSIFWSCKNLENVTIGEGVTYISEEMFSMCQNLKNVNLPDSIVTIGPSAFECCYLLAKIELPDNLKTISSSAFYMCESLDNVVIPDSVTEIAQFAFYQCENLKAVKLSDKLTVLGESAFEGTNLKSIVIPDGITMIEDSTFAGCKKLTDVTIPSSVTSIGRYAFIDCDALKNITIPSSVTEIGYNAVGYSRNSLSMVPQFKIYGIAGSVAENYATKNKIKFIEVSEDTKPLSYDVNGDGKITAADARIALRAAAKLQVLEGYTFNAADIDRNGVITASDARKILRRAAKLE